MQKAAVRQIFADEITLRDWRLLQTAAGECDRPDQIEASRSWLPAKAPGAAAEGLREAGRWRLEAPAPLHDSDFWYCTELNGWGRKILRFEGLATIAEIWFHGEKIAASENMFLPLEVEIELSGPGSLYICFRSLTAFMGGLKGKRARWRTALVDDQNLRFVRTSFLGHMPGWCPAVDIVGPYRPIAMRDADALSPRNIRLRSEHRGGRSFLSAEAGSHPVFNHAGLRLVCGGHSAEFECEGDTLRALIATDDFDAWDVHTHGRPALYDVEIECVGARAPLGKVGFRSLEIDRGDDGTRFGLVLNGRRIFARGVCWTPADIVSLGCDPAAYRRAFEMLRDAGVNLIRVPGITIYEAPEFYRLADEFGILVWQDAQLANFDYPFGDAEFRVSLEAEIASFLQSTSRHCSLAIFCGGSEMQQQAAMLGLPKSVWSIDYLERELAALTRRQRPDVCYVANSPCDGELPFFVNKGVGHYYGVGAYMRPLDDARRADVAFAGECLAFANVPDQVTLDKHLNVSPAHHPLWKARAPRDRGASWDFEDVREFYMSHLYRIDCARMRREEPRRYLDFARAAPVEAMEAAFGEWRRPQSGTGGGLVFLWRDFLPGAGWGIIDSTGRPKSVYYGLKRAFAPVQLILTDEGVNGLHAHVVNETAEALDLRLEIDCLAQGVTNVASGNAQLSVAAHGAATIAATEVLGAFFDVNYAYRFGPPAHDVVVARLYRAGEDEALREAYYFPLGRGHGFAEPQISAGLEAEDDACVLTIRCERFAQTVAISCEDFVPEDNYFHLAPGRAKTVRLCGDLRQWAPPAVTITALNSARSASPQ